MLYKIGFPKENCFTGVYLTVTFKDGIGETDSAYLAEKFRKKGLAVEKPKAPPKNNKKE